MVTEIKIGVWYNLKGHHDGITTHRVKVFKLHPSGRVKEFIHNPLSCEDKIFHNDNNSWELLPTRLSYCSLERIHKLNMLLNEKICERPNFMRTNG